METRRLFVKVAAVTEEPWLAMTRALWVERRFKCDHCRSSWCLRCQQARWVCRVGCKAISGFVSDTAAESGAPASAVAALAVPWRTALQGCPISLASTGQIFFQDSTKGIKKEIATGVRKPDRYGPVANGGKWATPADEVTTEYFLFDGPAELHSREPRHQIRGFGPSHPIHGGAASPSIAFLGRLSDGRAVLTKHPDGRERVDDIVVVNGHFGQRGCLACNPVAF
jgi:hypothetical protein